MLMQIVYEFKKIGCQVKSRNRQKIKAYLTKYFRNRKSNSSSTTIRVNYNNQISALCKFSC